MGVIGCGEIAQIMHLPFLTELRDLFEVRAVCDILTADHAPVAIAAAQAGKHSFVEKPMCFGIEEGRAMQAAAAARGVCLMVGYMKRYDPGYEYAQRLFHDMAGARLIRVHDLTGRGPLAPQEIYSLYRADDLPEEVRARLRDAAQARLVAGLGLDRPDLVLAYAIMLGLSSHDMTILRGAFGDPVAVRYAEVLAGGTIVLAVLEYPGDVRCVWEIGNIPQATRTWFDEELTVFGAAQTITVQFPNPYVRYAPTLVRVREMDGAAQSERAVTASFDEAFRREWRHFHHCVTSGAAPLTGAADGLRDVELLRAIVRCAADGAPVALGG
jgi:predicted dehydrogenase